jgi:hypothetical protein
VDVANKSCIISRKNKRSKETYLYFVYASGRAILVTVHTPNSANTPGARNTLSQAPALVLLLLLLVLLLLLMLSLCVIGVVVVLGCAEVGARSGSRSSNT